MSEQDGLESHAPYDATAGKSVEAMLATIATVLFIERGIV